MTNTRRLLAVAGLLVGAVAIALLWSVGGPGSVREPNDAVTPQTPVPGAAAVEEPESAAAGSVPDADLARQEATPSATTGSLRVMVRWHDGDPAAGIAVSFRTATRGVPVVILERAISGDDGRIRVDDLPAGPVRLRSDRGGELEHEVVAGRAGECELTLPEGIAIEGVVVDRRDRPVPGAEVWLQTEHTDWTAGRVIARAAADGTFVLRGIPAGLSLGALAPGHAPSQLLDLDTVDTSSPPLAVRLVVEDGAGGVEGRVVRHDGTPIRGATVAVGKRPSHMNHRGGDQWVEQWTPRTTESDADGHFAVAGVKTGTWPVAARALGFGFWRGQVEVAASESAWLDVTLGEMVTVQGTVTDQHGTPLAEARVRAYDQAPQTPFIQGGQIDFDETFGYVAAVSDSEGRYRLTGATPGEVHLFAQPKQQRRSSEAVPFATAVLEAELGARLAWNPVIDPGRTIEGVVRYSDAQPMGNVFITAKDEGGGPQHLLVNGTDGSFRFVCLEGASYSLHVQYWSPPKGTPPLEQAGVVPGQGSVELRAPFNKPVDGPKGEVMGRIDDAGGRLPHEKALQILLVSDKNWWRTNVEIEEGAFKFDDVAAGRYRVMAMAGENAIAQGDWFELAAAEVRDVGVLRTEAPGSVVIRLERDAETREVEPKLYFRLEGWSRGSQIEMGRRSEARLHNLTAGSYTVTGYAAGLARLTGEVEVRVGEESELRFRLRAAALVRFAIWFPAEQRPGTATTRIVAGDGEVLSEFERTHGDVPPRPYETSAYVPRGEWTITVTTDTGLRGSTELRVDAVDREHPVVRVDVK